MIPAERRRSKCRQARPTKRVSLTENRTFLRLDRYSNRSNRRGLWKYCIVENRVLRKLPAAEETTNRRRSGPGGLRLGSRPAFARLFGNSNRSRLRAALHKTSRSMRLGGFVDLAGASDRIVSEIVSIRDRWVANQKAMAGKRHSGRHPRPRSACLKKLPRLPRGEKNGRGKKTANHKEITNRAHPSGHAAAPPAALAVVYVRQSSATQVREPIGRPVPPLQRNLSAVARSYGGPGNPRSRSSRPTWKNLGLRHRGRQRLAAASGRRIEAEEVGAVFGFYIPRLGSRG